jgi:hypothetical protein
VVLRHLVLMPLAGLGVAGCAGTVAFTDLDEFGTVRSAVWLERRITAEWGDVDQTSHGFQLSSKPGLCAALGLAYDDLDEQLEWIAAAEDGEAECEAWRDAYVVLGALLGDFSGPGDDLLTMTFTEEDDYGIVAEAVKPSDGPYSAGSVADERFSLALNRYTDEYYSALADGFSVVDGVCVPPAADVALEAMDRYSADAGTAEVTRRGEAKIAVQFDVTLLDEGGADAGAAEGEFTARNCPVSLDLPQGFALDP